MVAKGSEAEECSVVMVMKLLHTNNTGRRSSFPCIMLSMGASSSSLTWALV